MSGNFEYCTGLTGTIPEDIYSSLTNARIIGRSFSGCTGLSGEIPKNLFVNNSKIAEVPGMFQECTGLSGEAPKFWEIPTITRHDATFKDCLGLSNYETIPRSWKEY